MSRPASNLANWTTMRVGGPPELFVRAKDESTIRSALDRAHALRLPVFPLGGGSNIIVSDDGISGCVLLVDVPGIAYEDQGSTCRVTAGAGVQWDTFVEEVTNRGLQGTECLSGIPGAVGATPIQNVGAYGQEVSQVIESVEVMSRRTGEVHQLSSAECQFRYRNSLFKEAGAGQFIVLRVTFSLRKNTTPDIRYRELARALEIAEAPQTLLQVRDTVVSLRRKKSMVPGADDENRRSCGSFFVNTHVTPDIAERISRVAGESPPSFPGENGKVKIPSAWLIEHAGLERGSRWGPVGLSTRHALCLVAHEGARAKDIINFAWAIRRRVEEAFEVTLIPEPQFWGFSELDQGLPIVL